MENKCVMVIDSDLPIGFIANTAAVLALTLGKKIEGIIGSTALDRDGLMHEGITTIPIPILKGSRSLLKELRDTVSTNFPDLILVDFSNAAQTTTRYDDYVHKIGSLPTDELQYLGIAIYGDHKNVKQLTGSLPLLR